MPHKRRKDHEGAIHHIVSKGNNGNAIYAESIAKTRFLYLLTQYIAKYDIDLIAYCVMDNHVHLLVRSGSEHISKFMQALQLSYSKWYQKYKGTYGRLYARRYVNYICSGVGYVKNVCRYIHANPIKAGITVSYHYEWSSYKEYKGDVNICKVDYLEEYFGLDAEEFSRIHNTNFTDELKKALEEIELIKGSGGVLEQLFMILDLDREVFRGANIPEYYKDFRQKIAEEVFWKQRVSNKEIADFFNVSHSYSHRMTR